MQVGQLWIHPVKSMIGQRVEHIEVGPEGVAGDRAWALGDDERGGLTGAKRIGALMKLRATYEHGHRGDVVITLPDGSTVRSDDPTVHARLSAALDHRVTLWPLQPADDLAAFRAGTPDGADPMADLRAILGLVEGDPLPDLSAFVPGSPSYVPAPDTYVDARPVMLMTTSALAALRRDVPDSVIDVRRFRPNIVIDTGDEPGHPEFDWAGTTLHVGTAAIKILGPCVRCVMITREIDADTPGDRAILRHAIAELGQNIGAYATVATAGSISTGDPVTLG